MAVDAVTGDGHQVTSAGHGVTEQSQVAVVDVGTVEGDDVVQLPLQSLSHSLNSQDLTERKSRRGEGKVNNKDNKNKQKTTVFCSTEIKPFLCFCTVNISTMSLEVVLTGSTSFSLSTLMRLTPSVSRIHSCRALNSPSSVMMIFFLLSVWGKCMYT